MLLKCTVSCESALINLPENYPWTLAMNHEAPNGSADLLIYLEVGDRTYFLADADDYCMGRDSLPESAIEDLFADAINKFYELLSSDNSVAKIDFDEILEELVEERKNKWAAKGYITIDENGNW